MGAPRSCCIDQNAGRVMSQENALTDNSRPQKTISSGLTASTMVSLSPYFTGRGSATAWQGQGGTRSGVCGGPSP